LERSETDERLESDLELREELTDRELREEPAEDGGLRS
jgi:hypothetical protein